MLQRIKTGTEWRAQNTAAPAASNHYRGQREPREAEHSSGLCCRECQAHMVLGGTLYKCRQPWRHGGRKAEESARGRVGMVVGVCMAAKNGGNLSCSGVLQHVSHLPKLCWQPNSRVALACV